MNLESADQNSWNKLTRQYGTLKVNLNKHKDELAVIQRVTDVDRNITRLRKEEMIVG